MFKKNRINKVKSKNYLRNKTEPIDNPTHDSLANDETVLVENSALMRNDFRSIAKRLRIIRIHGIRKK